VVETHPNVISGYIDVSQLDAISLSRSTKAFILTGHDAMITVNRPSSRWRKHAYGVVNLKDEGWAASSPANFLPEDNPDPTSILRADNFDGLLKKIETLHEGEWPTNEQVKTAIDETEGLFDVSHKRVKTDLSCWLTAKPLVLDEGAPRPTKTMELRVRAAMEAAIEEAV